MPPCPKCGLPMTRTNSVKTSLPVQYGYRCEACGTSAHFTQAELDAFPRDPERIHITEGSAFLVRDEDGREINVGPGWLAITEAEYAELAQAQDRLGQVAAALLNVLMADGMIRKDIDGMTGPELLMAADVYCAGLVAHQQEVKADLVAGDVVPREDGRFYVPVRRTYLRTGSSDIVLRVASDAFDGDVLATALFADEIVHRWNGAR